MYVGTTRVLENKSPESTRIDWNALFAYTRVSGVPEIHIFMYVSISTHTDVYTWKRKFRDSETLYRLRTRYARADVSV